MRTLSYKPLHWATKEDLLNELDARGGSVFAIYRVGEDNWKGVVNVESLPELIRHLEHFILQNNTGKSDADDTQ